jgi:hypothetical protein
MLAFFEHVEAGTPFVGTRELAERVLPGELKALRSAGILRPASPRLTRPGAAPVDPLDLAQEEISPSDMVRALRAIYGAEQRGLPTAGSFADRRVVNIGWTGTGAEEREIVLSPTQRTLSLALVGIKRTLVLVPTARGVTDALRAKHGPRAWVVLEVLAEVLGARDGVLVRLDGQAPPSPPPVASSAPLPRTRPKGLAAASPRIPGAKKWRDVSMYYVDDLTLRVDVGKDTRRVTYVDFGLAHARNRKPRKEWQMLVQVCEGSGGFLWRNFGQHQAAQKVVSRLRARLKEVFGLRETPFGQFSVHHGWRARFRAYPEPPAPRPFVPRRPGEPKGEEED